MPRVFVTVSGYFDKREGRLYADEAADRYKILALVGIRMRRAFAQNFAQGGRPAWPPLSPRTQREKMGLFAQGLLRGRKVNLRLQPLSRPQPQAPGSLFALVRSGRLLRSVTQRGKAGNITRIDAGRGRITVGTSVFYGLFHQEGTRKMPARPFLSIPDEDWAEIIAEVTDMMLFPDRLSAATSEVE